MAGAMLDAARAYLALGLHPIPSRGKIPAVEWKDYQTEGPHADQLDVWWGERDDLSVGAVVGGRYLLLDLDGDGAEGLLHNVNVVLPKGAPRVKTPHGQHVLLGVDEPVGDRIALVSGANGARCQVDVRGVGFHVMPPSPGYTWLVPLRRPFPRAPEALLRLIREPRASALAGDGAADYAAILEGVPQGQRHAELTRAAGHLLGLRVPPAEVVKILYGAADRCSPPHPHGDVDTIVRDLAAKDAAKVSRVETTRTPVLVRLADVEAERVEWVWRDRIARGKLTLTIGEPGDGKSTFLRDVGARVTRGLAWPDTGRAPAGGVVILSAEDGIADTERPRMDQQGADVARVWILRATKDDHNAARPFTLEHDLAALEEALRATGAVLLVIDPLSAYLGKKDSYKDSEIRGILDPLADLAERYRVAVVAVLHMTKGAQKRLLMRAQGSVAFVAVARTVLVVGKDPEVKGRRLVASLKNNLGPEAVALAFTIADPGDGGLGRLEWDAAPVEGAADRLLASDEPATRDELRERDEAAHFLRTALAEGPMASKLLMADAKANGIAMRTLWRAKRDLGIDAFKAQTVNSKPGAWYWSQAVTPP